MTIHRPDTNWTSERVANLVAHYHAGLSAAESAELLGAASKNAVVSKRRRLGLLGFAAIAPLPVGYCPSPPRQRRFLRVFPGPPPLPSEPLPDMEGPLPPDAAPRILAHRGARRCAWPLGPAEEPGSSQTLFCGAPNQSGRCYCPTHAARAYQARPQGAMAEGERR